MNKILTTDGQTGSEDPTTSSTAPVDGQNEGNKSQEDSGKELPNQEEQLDVSKLDPKVQKLIQSLRKENGDHRTKNKNLVESHSKLKSALIESGLIENDEESPEEKLKSLTNGFQSVSLANHVLRSALKNGVEEESLEYFEFLVQKRMSSLEEGSELTHDDLTEIALAAKGRGTSSVGTTSVGSGSATKPNPEGSGEVTVSQFVHMSMSDKTVLFKKNPDLYNRLFSEAKSKKLLVR